MRLCWLIPNDRGGGIAPVAQACCQQLAKLGYDLTLLLVTPSVGRIQASQEYFLDSLNLVGGANDAPNALLEWLCENPQDVLFLNGCEQADAVIPYLPANLYCIYVVHDTAPRYWNSVIQQEHNLDGIVAVSETVAQKFKANLKNPDKLSIIPNGCHFPDLDFLNTKRSNDIVFLGGDNPTKGAFDVLGVWQKLVKSSFTGKLHWFGSLAPAFKRKVFRLPQSGQICLYGHAPRDLIFSTAATAKALLMLSRVEPFGMATIEAMSMGCVPIAWDIETGTKEIIGDSETGVFAPLGNTTLIAEAVLNVLDRHTKFESYVINHVRTHFNAKVMGQKYEALIQTMAVHPPIHRSHDGLCPPAYKPPLRKFQLLPAPLRSVLRQWIGFSPRLGYFLRDLRGF
jgi:glycosyltransferase involved in cell wall biosynthesis